MSVVNKALMVRAAVVASLLISGCSTQAPRVDCEWRLTLINAPTPVIQKALPTSPRGEGP